MPLPTSVLKQRLANQQWSSHNIRLNDELSTNPALHDFALDDRLKAVLRIFRLIFGESLQGISIADLGCLEGGFALALALRGAQVLGIEARKINFEKLELLREHFDLPGLQFHLGDVKDFDAERFGHFDSVLALGILYHLDRPVEWLRKIAGATRRVLIVDTHFAPSDQHALSQIDPRLSNLSEIENVVIGSTKYSGRWFTEYPPDADPELHVWASYSNWRSFWLTKESLVRAMRDAGFALVVEQHDYSAGQYEHFHVKFPRTLMVGIKL